MKKLKQRNNGIITKATEAREQTEKCNLIK